MADQTLDEALLSGLVNHMFDGFAVLSPKGVHLDVNPALCEMTGFSREELIGTGLPHPYWPPEDLDDMAAGIGRDLSGDPAPKARVFMRKDGTRFPVLIAPSVVRDEAGRPTLLVTSFKDMTALNESQAALRESEQRLALAKEAAALGIYDLDVVTGSLRWDTRIRALWGVGPDEPVSMETVYAGIHPDDRDLVRAGIDRQFDPSGDGSFTAEYRVISLADGTERCVTETGTTIFKDGRAVRAVGSVQDITDRKNDEEELRANRALLKAVVEGTTDAIYVKDRDGRYLLFNDAAERAVGKPAADVLGRDDLDLFPADEARVVMDGDRRVMESGAVSTYEEPVTLADGALHTFVSTKGPVRDAAGQVIGIFGVARDMTDQLRAQEELRASEAEAKRVQEELRFTKLAVEHAGDSVFWMSTDGAVLHANQTACAALGYGPEECQSLTIHDIDPDYGPERWPGHVEELRSAGSLRFETRHRTVDGRDIPVEVTANYLEFEGEGFILSFARDIAQRRLSQEALRRSEANFRSLVESGSDVSVRYGLDLRYLYVSPVMSQYLDVRPEDLIGKTHREAGFPDELADMFDDALRRAVETGETIEAEFSIADRAGGPMFLEARVYPEFDPEGQPSAVVTVTRDVTARKLAEDALRQSEALFQSILSASPDDITITDLEGRVRMASPSALTMFGNERMEEILGRPLVEFLVPEDRERALVSVARMHQGVLDGPGEYLALRADGSTFPMEVNGEFIRDASGQPTGLVFIVRDITERNRVVEALRESKVIRDVSESVAHVGSWSFDMASRQATWSPEMYRLFGASEEEPLGDSWSVLDSRVHPDDLSGLRQTTAAVFESGEPVPVEFRVVLENGEERVLHGDATMERNEAGRAVRLFGYYQDVTEIRRAHRQVRRLNEELERRVVSRTAQLEAANKELEAFAYSVSHDLRAPLRAIDGFSEMVVKDAGDRLDPESADHLQRIRRAAKRLSRLVDDLLGLSRVSRRDMNRERCDLSAMAADVAAELDRENPQHTVELTVAPGLEVEADPYLLRVILRELLDNAWKFTTPRDVGHVEVGVLEADGEHAYFVRDDGVGYDPRYAGQLFGAFQRMHASTDFPGDGMGLATVQRLVLRHGGRVWAEAALDAGATFYFTLPAAGAASA